ncbi:MAG: bifunctional nuclease family protein [Deltaproteobacteria bacterium]|nr:MAG: bifunctional nuclease family protein [Deltaproteobacteria bacterium]
MNTEPRPAFVALVFAACAAAAICKLAWPAGGDLPVEMRAEEIVRVTGGQPILVLAEKNGARRLGVPVSRAEAASIEAALQGSRGPGMAAIESLGGRIVRASIDGARSRHDFRGHLSLGSGAREVLIEASAGEALSLALQAGAQIVADPGLLEEAGVTADELRGASASKLHGETDPAPVLGI